MSIINMLSSRHSVICFADSTSNTITPSVQKPIELPKLYAYTKPLLIAPGSDDQGALDISNNGDIVFSVLNQVAIYSAYDRSKIIDISRCTENEITCLQWIRSMYGDNEPDRFVSHSKSEGTLRIWQKRQHVYRPCLIYQARERLTYDFKEWFSANDEMFIDTLYFNTDVPKTYVLIIIRKIRKLVVFSVSRRNNKLATRRIFTSFGCTAAKLGFANMYRDHLLLVAAFHDQILSFHLNEDDKFVDLMKLEVKTRTRGIDIVDIICKNNNKSSGLVDPYTNGIVVWRNSNLGFGYSSIALVEDEFGQLEGSFFDTHRQLFQHRITDLRFTDDPDDNPQLFCFVDNNMMIMSVNYNSAHPFEHFNTFELGPNCRISLNYGGIDVLVKDPNGEIRHYCQSKLDPKEWNKLESCIGHVEDVVDLTWISEGKAVVSCCSDGTVQLFSQLKQDILGRTMWREFAHMPLKSELKTICGSGMKVYISRPEIYDNTPVDTVISELVPSKTFLSRLQNYTTINVSGIQNIPDPRGHSWNVKEDIPAITDTPVTAMVSLADESLLLIAQQGSHYIFVCSITSRYHWYSFGMFETDIIHMTFSLNQRRLLAVCRYECNVYERGDGILRSLGQFKLISSHKAHNTSSTHYICGAFMGATYDYVIADASGIISMFESDQIIQTYQTHASDLTILSCASYCPNFAPNSYFFAAGFQNGRVEFFMWDKVSCARDIPIYGKFFRPHLRRVNQLEFSKDSSIPPNNYMLASCSMDRVLYINNIRLSDERYDDRNDEYD